MIDITTVIVFGSTSKTEGSLPICQTSDIMIDTTPVIVFDSQSATERSLSICQDRPQYSQLPILRKWRIFFLKLGTSLEELFIHWADKTSVSSPGNEKNENIHVPKRRLFWHFDENHFSIGREIM